MYILMLHFAFQNVCLTELHHQPREKDRHRHEKSMLWGKTTIDFWHASEERERKDKRVQQAAAAASTANRLMNAIEKKRQRQRARRRILQISCIKSSRLLSSLSRALSVLHVAIAVLCNTHAIQ
jgi:hypothetical protein